MRSGVECHHSKSYGFYFRTLDKGCLNCITKFKPIFWKIDLLYIHWSSLYATVAVGNPALSSMYSIMNVNYVLYHGAAIFMTKCRMWMKCHLGILIGLKMLKSFRQKYIAVKYTAGPRSVGVVGVAPLPNVLRILKVLKILYFKGYFNGYFLKNILYF